MSDKSGRAEGGLARARKMSPAQRSESAKKAAAARWDEPRRVISGSQDRPLVIGDVHIECYVLEDGTRVVTQGGLLTALGRSRRVNTKPSDDSSLPPILRAQALSRHITPELLDLATPVRFITPSGSRASGYRAEVLPLVCEAWLAAQDAGDLTRSQMPIARAAGIIVRGLARVGIIALVDEATGYQDVRARDALAKILEAWVADELQPWVKTFDVEFYKQMFRLRRLPFDPSSVKRPPYFGHLTNDVVYERVAPGVLAEIKEQRAKDEKKRRAKFHQQLTSELGHPKLREHIASVTAVMKLSDDWSDFTEKLDRVHPKFGVTPPMWRDGDDLEYGL